MNCYPDMNSWWGSYSAPGHLGLPIHDVRVLNVADEPLYVLSFVPSEHVTPGPAYRLYKLAAFRKRQEFVQVAVLDTLLQGHTLQMVTGDFDGNGADEIAISSPASDASDLYHLILNPDMDIQLFAQHVGWWGRPRQPPGGHCS